MFTNLCALLQSIMHLLILELGKACHGNYVMYADLAIHRKMLGTWHARSNHRWREA
jgi:hypothetical protein